MSTAPDGTAAGEGAAPPSGGRATRFIHLNGPPGIGKSTVAMMYVDRYPGTLDLDVDLVHQLIGGWQDDDNRTWDVVTPLVRAMAATQLRGGRDVVMPDYLGDLDGISPIADLAVANGAEFREVVLLDDRTASIQRFDRRAAEDSDPWIRHHHRLVGQRGAADVLGKMYDDLVAIAATWPEAIVVPSVEGAAQETFERVMDAMSGPVR